MFINSAGKQQLFLSVIASMITAGFVFIGGLVKAISRVKMSSGVIFGRQKACARTPQPD